MKNRLAFNAVKTAFIAVLAALTLACGYSSKNYGTGSMPAIQQLNPNSATAGDPAFTLTVNGSNFATQAVVNWNGKAQATTYGGGGQLTIEVPASAVANATTVQISVTNPATSSGGMYGRGTPAQTSNPVNFMIN